MATKKNNNQAAKAKTHVNEGQNIKRTASASKKTGKKERGLFAKMRQRAVSFMQRRPHRSFRLTRRRDYVRSWKIPGYWAFTGYVFSTLKQQKKLFLSLIVFYAIISLLAVGLTSQSAYTELGEVLRETGGEVLSGAWGRVGEAGIMLVTTLSGSISESPTEAQQIYAAILGLMTWLTTVWLLRNVLAGKKVKLRDGLYSSGAPILATAVVAIVVVVQLLPIALAAIGYAAAAQTGLLDSGAAAMLFWILAGLLAVLSLYWMTSTLIALAVVTLPGTYPFRAISVAGDFVLGRRLRILYRLLWMLLTILIAWAIVMIPVIIFDAWLKGVWPAIAGLPIVPIALLIMSSVTVVWMASYIYLLYRRVIADDAERRE